MILAKRFQQNAFAVASYGNRAAGGGSGSGFNPIASAGYAAAGDQGGYSTANASTWTDITNTSFTINVSRTIFLEYRIVVAGARTAGAGTTYVKGTIVGFDDSASMLFNGAQIDNAFMWYSGPLSFPIQPASYTVKLQAATDAGNTVHVYQFFHQVVFLGT